MKDNTTEKKLNTLNSGARYAPEAERGEERSERDPQYVFHCFIYNVIAADVSLAKRHKHENVSLRGGNY